MRPTDIDQRTLDALDWGVVVEALSSCASTTLGARMARESNLLFSRDAVVRAYHEVEEVLRLQRDGATIPLAQIRDITDELEDASHGGSLDIQSMSRVASTIRALFDLERWLFRQRDQAPHLLDLLQDASIDPELLNLLERSFDSNGQLSQETYPTLRSLTQRAAQLRLAIRNTMESLLRSEHLANAIQDRYITRRAGRYVLPIKASRHSRLGIVHDRSRTGETCYVEPMEVVEQQNALRDTEILLEREIRKILMELSRNIGTQADSIFTALEVSARVDLACARAALGRLWDGNLPGVGTGGTVHLPAARHPVLALRRKRVVPNDLSLNDDHGVLILTGPNTGGKTIALKTLGLAVLCTRAAIPLPAGPDCRVDFFPHVFAHVGDLQSVQGDMSTFSAQVEFLKDVLDCNGRGTMVLLDEIAVGTDPAEGAALARAVLESLGESGTRVAATSHYVEIKALAALDGRFSVAAVQYVDGKPTYHISHDTVGRSHALATARRLGLPKPVLARASQLLGRGSGDIAHLMDRLEKELDRASEIRRSNQRETARLQLQAAKLQKLEQRLQDRRTALENSLLDELRQKLRIHEEQVKAMVAALQADPHLARAGRTLQEIRGIQSSMSPTAKAPRPPKDSGKLQPGDLVLVRPLNRRGYIVFLKGNRVQVQVGSTRTWVKITDIDASSQSSRAASGPEKRTGGSRARWEKRPVCRGTSAHFGGLPMPSNTVDLRGKRVEEALSDTEFFLDGLLLKGHPVAYLLHGHGTGALKAALRSWLPTCPYARRWRPGDEREGGDAWTVVELSSGETSPGGQDNQG